MHTKPPLTAAQVSGLLGVSSRHVRRLALAGTLPALGKLPGVTGCYLFDPADVSAYLDRSGQ